MSASEVVYLCGPISLGGTCTPDEIAEFSQRFHAEAARLRALGFSVINPTEVEGEPWWPWTRWMRHGLRAVANADVVAVLPGWHRSRGAMLEAYVASQLDIPVLPVGEVGV